jgi:predicted metal-dependent hydrolase
MSELPPEFWQGVEEFNQQQFYACHDTLEALWIEAIEPEKTLYQGVLQIAVALYHLSNQNYRGAIILLGEGMNRLRRCQSAFAEIDIAQLLVQSRDLQANLQQLSQKQAEPEQLKTNLDQNHQQNNSDVSELPRIERIANLEK